MPRFPLSSKDLLRPAPTAIAVAALLGSGALIAVSEAAPKPARKPAAKPAGKVRPAIPAAAAASAPVDAAGVELFERSIRPLLAEQCFSCHGEKAQLGGLRLDSRAWLMKGTDAGKVVVVPGHPEKSPLVHAIQHTGGVKMPPSGKLPSEKIEALVEWVKRGAPWPAGPEGGAKDPEAQWKERMRHWSFLPLRPAAVPAVKSPAWAQNPVDRFIFAKLQAKGLTPAKPADRRTLIRRVTFDLIGLPPTPEEVEAFVNDRSPDAYRKVVERLLSSPHYGERWARHWLDLVRYAETDGHEFDFEKHEPWRYRDYVVRAFNADVPYDQLVREHVAGDLLPQPRRNPENGTNESIVGTTFWWLGEGKHSPVDLKEDERERIDNQLDVFGKTFFGLSMGCARCHDHKFDPISAKDYYALSGYLKSSRYQLAAIDPAEKRQEAVRALEKARTELVPVVKQRAAVAGSRLASVAETLAAAGTGESPVKLVAQDGAGAALPREWQSALADAGKRVDHPLHALAVLKDTPPAGFAQARAQLAVRFRNLLERSGSAAAAGTSVSAFDGATFGEWSATGEAFGSGPVREAVSLASGGEPRAVGVRSGGLADSGRFSPRLHGVLRSPTFTLKAGKLLYRMAGQGTHLNLIIQNFQRIRDPLYGGLRISLNNPHLTWYAQDVTKYAGLNAYLEFVDYGGGWIAIDEVRHTEGPAPAPAPNPQVARLLQDDSLTSYADLASRLVAAMGQAVQDWSAGRLAGTPAGDGRIELADWALRLAAGASAEGLPMPAQLVSQWKQAEAAVPQPTFVMAMLDGTPEDDRVCIRGSHKTTGDVAPRRLPEVLAGAKQPVPADGSGRLELTRRMLASPLLARVMVNRVWQHHFGEGLVRTPDDFGLRGEKPTHPELLDWLASWFTGLPNAQRPTPNAQRWSLKQLHRLLVLSQAYQMASRGDAKAEQADPQNLLLHRMPVLRLQAEQIRDSMLAVSGKLDPKLFGPSVMPHLTPFMEGRGRPDTSGPMDGEGRRSLYIGVRRNFLTPLFLAFDYPIPFNTMGKRSVSTVPAQALSLMNNPFVIEQAGYWGRKVLAQPGLTPEARVTRMYQEAFARPPSAKELGEALQFVRAQDKEYGTPDDPRSWGDLGHVLMNVKEFIFLN